MKKFWKKAGVVALTACILCTAVSCKDDNDPSIDATDGTIADTKIVLAQDGQSDYTVVVPASATEAEDYAADLLVEQFQRATGVTLSVAPDGGQTLDKNKKVISVGRTSITLDSGLSLTTDELTYDGYKLKRYGNTVVLCGAEDSGTIFSVGDFLHYQFNYEVYAADEIYIESTDLSYLKDFDVTEVPDFWGRSIDGYLGKYPETALARRLRTREMTQESWGKGSSEDWIGGNCHALRNILPPSKYNDPNIPETYHPEWYKTNQLCLTNEELIQEFIENVKALVLENPNAKIINLSEEDMGGFATCCQTCKDEVNAYGLSGYVVRFCNRIITAIESWLDETGSDREFQYTTFAYTSGTLAPPVDIQADGTYKIKDESCRPHEKLYIRLAPLDPYCYQHEFEDPNCKLNVSYKTAIDGWRTLTNHFYVWDYSADYRSYLPFYNVFGTLQKNLQMYKEIGVANIIRQDTTGEAFTSFSQFRGYLTSELMWDVNADVEALTKDFFDKYYKTGASYMLEYYDLMRSHLMMMDATSESGIHYGCYFDLNAEHWPIRVLEKALDLIDKATATYESLKTTNPDQYEVMYIRTLQESVCVRFMILENYASYYNINSAAYTEMLDQFEIDAYKVGVVFWKENQGLSSWLEDKRAS